MKRKSISVALLALPLYFGAQAEAQVAADITADIQGTYELTYDFATSASPFSNGDTKTFVINAADDTLCVDGTLLSDPYHRTAGATEALWDESGTSTSFATTLGLGSFNEINVYVSDNWVGQFFGSKVSDDVSCSSSGSSDLTISAQAQSMIALAEELYPTIFAQGTELRSAQGYIYRYFAAGGVYVGIKDGVVYLKGGPFGNAITSKGLISNAVVVLQGIKEDRASVEVDIDVEPGSELSGLYDLTISGTVATVVGGFAAPPVDFNLTLDDVAAPNPGQTGEITNIITDTLAGVGGVSNIQIVVTNNTESRVTFTVAFSATQSGVSVEYELTYDYVR